MPLNSGWAGIIAFCMGSPFWALAIYVWGFPQDFMTLLKYSLFVGSITLLIATVMIWIIKAQSRSGR